MATDGVRGTGYSIRYEHGIFKQKIVEGQQVELPDSWLSTGEVWQIPAMDETREVKIGGTVDTYFDDNGKLVVNYHDYTPVLAVPYDMPISGYGTNNIARLRLWKAQSPIALDMKLFSSGEYLKALEKHALAETISMVLYPEDNHREGQSLRLKQQYFLVSATPAGHLCKAQGQVWHARKLRAQTRPAYQRYPSDSGYSGADAHPDGRERHELGAGLEHHQPVCCLHQPHRYA